MTIDSFLQNMLITRLRCIIYAACLWVWPGALHMWRLCHLIHVRATYIMALEPHHMMYVVIVSFNTCARHIHYGNIATSFDVCGVCPLIVLYVANMPRCILWHPLFIPHKYDQWFSHCTKYQPKSTIFILRLD